MAKRSSNHRRGVTLSEVLVSLLVMSIGVIALATLFPISTLRVVQATQLTQATQLRYNAEGMLAARPELLNGMNNWQAQRVYSTGEMAMSSLRMGRYFIATGAGTSGNTEPNWLLQPGQTTTDSGVTWQTAVAQNYVIDPIGWEVRSAEMNGWAVGAPSISPDYRNTFGRTTYSITGYAPPWPPVWRTGLPNESVNRIVRFRGAPPMNAISPFQEATAVNQALREYISRQTASLPDSYSLIADSADTSGFVLNARGHLVGLTINDVALLQSFDLAQLTTGQVDVRITLFDVSGRHSEMRSVATVTTPNGPGLAPSQVTWNEPIPWTLPPYAPGNSSALGRVKVEFRENRFSWMLVVRTTADGSAYPSIVTFFNRSQSGESELIHPAHFATQLRGANISDISDEIFFNNTVVVEFNPTGTDKPFLKRGGYVCDAQNNRWYRISNYEEVPNALVAQQNLDGGFVASELGTGPGAILQLDETIKEGSGFFTARVPQVNANKAGGAILMPGVIAVFPLNPVLSWEEE